VRSYILEPPDGQPRPISPEETECIDAMSQQWLACFRQKAGQTAKALELETR
jgi:hypothetical protein